MSAGPLPVGIAYKRLVFLCAVLSVLKVWLDQNVTVKATSFYKSYSVWGSSSLLFLSEMVFSFTYARATTNTVISQQSNFIKYGSLTSKPQSYFCPRIPFFQHCFNLQLSYTDSSPSYMLTLWGAYWGAKPASLGQINFFLSSVPLLV